MLFPLLNSNLPPPPQLIVFIWFTLLFSSFYLKLEEKAEPLQELANFFLWAVLLGVGFILKSHVVSCPMVIPQLVEKNKGLSQISFHLTGPDEVMCISLGQSLCQEEQKLFWMGIPEPPAQVCSQEMESIP